MQRIGRLIERAKGCAKDIKLQRQIIDSLRAQLVVYKLADQQQQVATIALTELRNTELKLNKRQRTAAWFRSRWKDMIAAILGIIVALEAGYIVYTQISAR